MAEKTKKATRQAPSLDWLEELESKVHAASEALRELRSENRDLSAENEKLRKRLEQAEETTEKAEKALKAAEEAAADGGGDAQGAGVWKRERREIRDRVERITERLEELLEG